MTTTIFPDLVRSGVDLLSKTVESKKPDASSISSYADAADLVVSNAEAAWNRFEAMLSDGVDGVTFRSFLDAHSAMLEELFVPLRSMAAIALDLGKQREAYALSLLLNRVGHLMEKADATKSAVKLGLPEGFLERAAAASAASTGVLYDFEEVAGFKPE